MFWKSNSKMRQVGSSYSLAFPVLTLDSLKRLTRRLSIGAKISCGYALVLGVAVLGMAVGITIGDNYQQQASEQVKDALEEIYFVNRLERALLQAQTHEQQLIFLLEKPELLQKESSHFMQYAAEINQLGSKLKSTQGLTKNSTAKRLPGEVEALKYILQTYNNSVEAYLGQTEELIKQIERSNLNPEEIEEAQKRLLNFNNSPLPLKIKDLSHELADYLKFAYTQYEQAESQSAAAQVIRVWIIAVSMLMSVAIASLLALYISRAIAQPIRRVTAVAQQATQDANFDRQAPVTTEDEVGVLAISLNTLIQRIAAYTQELELNRQTLERRVEERTQELSQKNQQLLQAYNQLNQTLENLRQTQAQLIQSEKMSSLGQMVAGIAHEINNPINFIYNNLKYANDYTQGLMELVRLYQQQYPNPTPVIQEQIEAIDFDFLVEDLPKTLSSMKIGAERIGQLVLSLRNFSRLDEAEIKLVNLHEGIENTLFILNHQLKQGIQVVKQYGDLPLVECYPAQLNQVFINILQNAIDALQEEADRPNKQIVIKTETIAPNQIRVSIQDKGPGIPPEIKDKIFEPFFTTKEVGKGTGLGLSICYQIINQHQGQIEVNSQVGQGTEFVISFATARSAIALPIQQSYSPLIPTSGHLFISTYLSP
jgi:signal transduction histidine kinase